MSTKNSFLMPLSSHKDDRKQMLHQLGFLSDTFRFQVVEQAWAFAPNPTARANVLAAYVTSELDATLLQALRQQKEPNPCHLVEGESGSGKTALAWHLMQTLTWEQENALVVLFDAAELASQTTPLSFSYHWASTLARALVLYLLDPRHANASVEVQDVAALQQAGGIAVERLLSRITSYDDIATLVWDTLRRPLWDDTVYFSNALLRAFSLVADPLFSGEDTVDATDFLREVPCLLQRVGIRKVYVFIDNLTDSAAEQPTIQWYLKQLMGLSSLGQIPLIKTLFATPLFATIIAATELPGSPFDTSVRYSIKWDTVRLQQMIRQRSNAIVRSEKVPGIPWADLLAEVTDNEAWYSTPRALLSFINELVRHRIDEKDMICTDTRPPTPAPVSGACLPAPDVSFNLWF